MTCMVKSPEPHLVCSLPLGHSGLHAAYVDHDTSNDDRFKLAWDQAGNTFKIINDSIVDSPDCDWKSVYFHSSVGLVCPECNAIIDSDQQSHEQWHRDLELRIILEVERMILDKLRNR